MNCIVLFVYLYIKKMCTWNRTSLAQNSESTHSYGKDHAGGGGGGAAYTWSNVSVKEKVRLSAGAYTQGGEGL